MNSSPDSISAEPAKMDLISHLLELRTRLFSSLIAILITTLAAFFFAGDLFDFFNKPLVDNFAGQTLIGTGPAEAFVIKLKVSLFAGIVLALPWIFYQLWNFITPGLHEAERKLVIPFISAATCLFIIGISFAYYLVMPLAFSFFSDQYGSIAVTPTIKIGENLNLMLKSMLAFGLTFQMPVISYFLAKIGVLTSELMLSSWRYVVVICVVIGAVLTPPDIFSQLLLSGPMLFLYLVSIKIVKIVEKNRGDPE